VTLNPVRFTEKVVGDFLKYQLTTYPFTDPRLRDQMRDLLSLTETRSTPLLKGPYLDLSRAYQMGAQVEALVDDGIFHPFLREVILHPSLYAHQEEAIRAIADGRPTLVSTGTGSGKTEAFLYPIISRCLELRDEGEGAGIRAIIIYPMNALAEDQLERIRGLLAGTGVTFGMYVGKTPERQADAAGERLPAGSSGADYREARRRAREERRGTAVHPPEERASREEMREEGEQPRILLTNVKQLELLLTRDRDRSLFEGAELEFLVLDEAHTFGGAMGGETACLVRRLRSFIGPEGRETVCVGTSATLVDPEGSTDAARDFAVRLFGVDRDQVALVEEAYAAEEWGDPDADGEPLAPDDPSAHLPAVLEALGREDDPGVEAARVFEAMTGRPIAPDRWQEDLYRELARLRIPRLLARKLTRPRQLPALAEEMEEETGREVSEEELLIWLALGSAARNGDRPLLRPTVHVFVRGIDGAVVTFPDEDPSPRLWLSAEASEEAAVEGGVLYRLPVTTCTTCGQHYFVHHLDDFELTSRGPGGGRAEGGSRVWEALDDSQGGDRVVLLDRLIGSDDEGTEKTHPLYFCRWCGAMHPDRPAQCRACGRDEALVELQAVESGDKHRGYLTSCLACGSPGRPWGSDYREPARPVRAVTVSDVHVLAQNMLEGAERKRLLVFTDNRQDAAFQAGWMRDHARRFRLRSVMMQEIPEDGLSVGDLVVRLDERFEEDDALSRALAPEVWQVHRKEAGGTAHARERERFLRIQVFRELTTALKQQTGLEPWGRIRVDYAGLKPDLPFIERWAQSPDIPADGLVEGIAAIVDNYRRRKFLLDREGGIFTRHWREGDREVQRGYMPAWKGVPKGLKLRRAASDDKGRVTQLISRRGVTLARDAVQKWGVPKDDANVFLEELWDLLENHLELLVPVTLKWSGGNVIPQTAGVRQIDADKVTIRPHRGRWVCQTCRRSQLRPTPRNACMAYRCNGTLEFEEEDPENYDLVALDENFTMIRPREHSGQVPNERREELEHLFKGQGERVNTLVATPTLELGVDIGLLDTVLLRNVPPRPANYWQRVGRAGRRHRLSVNVTYARPTTHDRSYFQDPEKLLGGRVEPPRFNLKNDLMVAKHVHATLLTRLHQLADPAGPLGDYDQQEVADALEHAFPPRIRTYLFDEHGNVRPDLYDVSPLKTVISKHLDDLTRTVEATFAERWPEEDRETVEPDRLREIVESTADDLQEVVRTLKGRRDWALRQMQRLDDVRRRKGTLERDEEALRDRCERLIKRFKGQTRRQLREREGYDDTVTYSVLAAEGFLPGYGLERGSVIATADVPWYVGMSDFHLSRPAAVAVREYVPGNMIYANGHRFVPRYFRLSAEDPVHFEVDPAHEAVKEVGGGPDDGVATLGERALAAVPISDVELRHSSHIKDEEDYRFQLSVALYGEERGRHGQGVAYDWGGRDIQFRQSVHLRLVNVGPDRLVQGGELGYPICGVCGQSASPLSSDRQLDHFAEQHEDRCNWRGDRLGLYADIVVDALSFPDCADREEGYSLAEAVRAGMAQVLEMERDDDAEVLVIGQSGLETVHAVLFDPMPGGSGLLEQATDRWDEVIQAAREIVEECPGACERSCVDCLRTYRNAYYHRHLDRRRAVEAIVARGSELEVAHDIPERIPKQSGDEEEPGVNVAEQRLRRMLKRAGFPEPEWHRRIDLGRAQGWTEPDCFWPGEHEYEPGICLYLDGLSEHIHGNPETAQKDRRIREELRSRHYDVLEVAASDLDDREAMQRHFYWLGRRLEGKERARKIAESGEWYGRDR